AAIAIPIYSNMQARARVAKAQSDLRGLYSALVAFGAHCGDVPNTNQAATNTWAWAAFGPNTCLAAVPLGIAELGQQVTDPNGVPAGPFYQSATNFRAPQGWTYTYNYVGVGRFTLIGLS